MSDIALVRFLFKGEWAPLKAVVDASSPQFGAIHDTASEKELIEILNKEPATLIIASLAGKEDLATILKLLKNHRRLFKDGPFKFSVVNFLNNKQVEAALMKLGCQEVIDPGIREKALKYKMDFWTKALTVNPNKEAAQAVTLKDKVNQPDAEKKSELESVKWLEPLKHVDDMWITKSTQDVKKVLSRWLVKFMGPSPFVAQWTEVQGKKGTWSFVFKEGARSNFHTTDGSWYYRGDQKPEFVWKENLWMVSGTKFQLFTQEEDSTAVRFEAGTQGIEICKNSTYALSREKIILDSFDQEILVKKGIVSAQSTSLEDDKRGDGLLTQDMSGQEAISNKYHGAVNPEADKENKPDQKLAIDSTTTGRLTGKSKTDDLGQGHYDGDVDGQGNKKAGPLKGHKGADAYQDEEGNAGVDDVGLDKYKGQLAHDGANRKSNYGGKSETDNLGGNHWEGEIGKKPIRNTEDFHDQEAKNAKPTGSALKRRLTMLDDLLPEGNADDPQEDVGPNALQEDASIDIDVNRSAPNRKPSEKKSTQTNEVLNYSDEALRTEPVTEDGRAITNDQAVVRAILKRLLRPNLETLTQIDDFFDDTVIVRLQSNIPEEGEKIELLVSFDYQEKNKKIRVTGECALADSNEDGETYCHLKLTANDLKAFQQFMEIYQLRQQHVHQFIKAAKGL